MRADLLAEPGQATRGGGRWYPSLVTLADGRVLAVGGHPWVDDDEALDDARHGAWAPEVYDPQADSWSYVGGDSLYVSWPEDPAAPGEALPMTARNYLYYPRMHVVPGGWLFLVSPNLMSCRWNEPSTGLLAPAEVEPPPNPQAPGKWPYRETNHTSVLLPLLPGEGYRARVLCLAGTAASVIDLGAGPDGPVPEWEATERDWPGEAPLRRHGSGTLLPTGEVFISGGINFDLSESPSSPHDIARVALLRCGSATHAWDGDQRYVGLAFTTEGSTMLSATAPPDGGWPLRGTTCSGCSTARPRRAGGPRSCTWGEAGAGRGGVTSSPPGGGTFCGVSPLLEHCPTGIPGLDAITGGGLPRGRTSLVAGGPGCAKTLLATEFLVRGALAGEPGVLLAFEETAEELTANVASLGWDLDRLQSEGRLVVDHVKMERERIDQTGDYDLEGLFVRLGFAIDEVGAKRVVLDTMEVLFSALDDSARLRAELRRLFTWLKGRNVTSIMTAERGDHTLTRHGLEEYVSDCVIVLDHRITDQMAVRRLRVVKLRGSAHGTNEYPFVIGAEGITVVPVTSFSLEHPASKAVVSTGVEGLDAMMARGGWFSGSTTMISGESGTGKTSFAAAFADAACRRGERCLYLAFEESADQLARNMASIGLDLRRWTEAGLLRIHASRPTQLGLERHLTTVYEQVERHRPHAVVVDPISDFTALGTPVEVKVLLMRIVDHLKNKGITTIFTSLTPQGGHHDPAVSSLIDNWVQLRNLELDHQRDRGLVIQKARGMSHSNQIREFVLSDDGIRLLDVVSGPEGVLTGRARAQALPGGRGS